MQIPAHQLSAHLAKGLRSLYVLHGDEPLLVQEAADAIRAAARTQGFTERSVFTVAGAHFDWAEVLASGASMGLFGDRFLVELRIPSGKPGKEGAHALQQLAHRAANSADVLTLVSLPRLDKASKTSAWFEALSGSGVEMALETIERAALPTWIAQRMAKNGQRVEAGEAGQRCLQFFADKVEGNLLAAHQEVQKLALLYPPGELTQAQVESAVLDVARFNVFKLTEAALAGQTARVQRMLEGLQAEGVAAVLVHHTLAEDIRNLKRIQQAVQAGRPLPLALREMHIWGVKERLFERIVPQMPAPAMDRLLWAAHQVDGIVKGLRVAAWPHDPWQALQRLAMMLTRQCRPR
ncbi:MAG: DNA polymerase III subunit delta [Betaproteobacteria bacterium]|nr:DNA polymerase III subunit delta [Betaproteobacteria bacterium]NBY04865.1 DNA polymerase III subunit delta [Betaproteobacteria bacterium]